MTSLLTFATSVVVSSHHQRVPPDSSFSVTHAECLPLPSFVPQAPFFLYGPAALIACATLLVSNAPPFPPVRQDAVSVSLGSNYVKDPISFISAPLNHYLVHPFLRLRFGRFEWLLLSSVGDGIALVDQHHFLSL